MRQLKLDLPYTISEFTCETCIIYINIGGPIYHVLLFHQGILFPEIFIEILNIDNWKLEKLSRNLSK